MTITELAELDRATRIRLLSSALADELRGRAIRASMNARLDGFDRNIARLRAEMDAL